MAKIKLDTNHMIQILGVAVTTTGIVYGQYVKKNEPTNIKKQNSAHLLIGMGFGVFAVGFAITAAPVVEKIAYKIS